MKREDGRSRQASHKARQVAKQAEWALRAAIEELNDDELSALCVLEVRPAPDATRLAVMFGLGPEQSPDRAEYSLSKHRGELRCRVAEAITRRKAPSLVFHLVPNSALEVEP